MLFFHVNVVYCYEMIIVFFSGIPTAMSVQTQPQGVVSSNSKIAMRTSPPCSNIPRLSTTSHSRIITQL